MRVRTTSRACVRVARSAHVIQPAKGRRQLVGLRQRSLAGCLPRPIDVKDDPGVVPSIQQASGLLVGREWATEQIIEKERTQGFNGRFCQCR